MQSLSEHWNNIFDKTDNEKLGCYESDFSQTIKFYHMLVIARKYQKLVRTR